MQNYFVTTKLFDHFNKTLTFGNSPGFKPIAFNDYPTAFNDYPTAFKKNATGRNKSTYCV